MINPRAAYSPIFDRPRLELPDGARLVVWPVVNVELWEIGSAMPRAVLPAPQGREVVPDIANYGWYDYGLRVGFWRLKRVLDRHGVRATLSLNAVVCDTHPELVRRSIDSGWEVLAHGYVQRVVHAEPDEREMVRRALSKIEEFTGTRPRGWMGCGLSETFDTPEILVEQGVEYVCDWCNDDQPYDMIVEGGSLVALPYSVELNDITIYAVQHHESREILERSRHAFDVLYEEGAESARVMAVSTHPYITGQAHRIAFFDQLLDYMKGFEGVVFMTGGEVLDWYRAARDDAGSERS